MAQATNEMKDQTLQFRTRVVTLSLSPEEAYVLATILYGVGGCPETSPRMFASRIRSALNAVGINDVGGFSYYSGVIAFEKDSLSNFCNDAIKLNNQYQARLVYAVK